MQALPTWIIALANHMWQSTLVAIAAWLLAIVLRDNRAHVRHWVWLTASVKFLVPFAVLVTFGQQVGRTLGWRSAASVATWPSTMTFAMDAVSQPFSRPQLAFTVEPGVFGIVRPVLLWPRGVGERLTDEQVEAILSHEVAHVRRRDNLAALLHMFVEALFWFHPLVWWIGARLVDERERACDEDVLRLGNASEAYAESVLRTCEVSIASRLACVSGVSGSDLETRIERIMRCDERKALTAARKVLLVATGFAAIAAPIAIGVVAAPHRLLAQSSAALADGPAPKFEVASVKANKAGGRGISTAWQPGGRFAATNVFLRLLLQQAYQIQDFQIIGGPDWINSDRFDIVAKAAGQISPSRLGVVGPEQLMVRSLIEERFKLVVHQEKRDLPIYALVLARSDGRLGSKLQPSTADCQAMAAAALARGGPPPSTPHGRPFCGMNIGPARIMGMGSSMSQLASALSAMVRRTVLDRTGLSGDFDVDLTYTPDQVPLGAPPAPPGAPAGAPSLPPIDPNGPSIFTAIQEQLGLKLESTKGPVDMLVIDSAQHPTED